MNGAAPRHEKPLPSDTDAERGILGSILLDGSLIDQVDFLTPDDFYSPLHRLVYRAMVQLHHERKIIDPIAIRDVLRKEDSFEAIGSATAITNLSYGLPYQDSIDHWAQSVKEKSVLRLLIRECSSIQGIAINEELPTLEVLETAAAKIQKLADTSSGTNEMIDGDLTDLVNESLAAGDDAGNRKLIATGLVDLDRQLGGGCEPGNLIVIGARPGAGKTALMTQIGVAAAKAGNVVLANSLEMPRRAYMDRMIASEARVNLQDYRNGDLLPKLKEDARRAGDAIAKWPIVIDGRPTLTPMLLRSRCRRVLARRKRLDLVLVDYLQLMRSDGRASHADNRRMEIEDFTRSLKLLAMELNVPIICLSQLSRAPETRKPPRPVLSDLRESGAIEQDADIVILIYRPDSDTDAPSELIVAKHRNGPTGSVLVQFFGSSTVFVNALREGR